MRIVCFHNGSCTIKKFDLLQCLYKKNYYGTRYFTIQHKKINERDGFFFLMETHTFSTKNIRSHVDILSKYM